MTTIKSHPYRENTYTLYPNPTISSFHNVGNAQQQQEQRICDTNEVFVNKYSFEEFRNFVHKPCCRVR